MGVPRLSVCADAQKVDRAKLAQTEFSIIEFDPETFRVLLDYLHTGSCPLTCVSIPGKRSEIYYFIIVRLSRTDFLPCMLSTQKHFTTVGRLANYIRNNLI